MAHPLYRTLRSLVIKHVLHALGSLHRRYGTVANAGIVNTADDIEQVTPINGFHLLGIQIETPATKQIQKLRMLTFARRITVWIERQGRRHLSRHMVTGAGKHARTFHALKAGDNDIEGFSDI